MRKPNAMIVLWQKKSSGYPADMRNSKVDKELWLSRIFS
jgi:hypothetical protein